MDSFTQTASVCRVAVRAPPPGLHLLEISPAQAREWIAAALLEQQTTPELLAVVQRGEIFREPLLFRNGFLRVGRQRLSAIAASRITARCFVMNETPQDTYEDLCVLYKSSGLVAKEDCAQ
jgi:hypothetical protein